MTLSIKSHNITTKGKIKKKGKQNHLCKNSQTLLILNWLKKNTPKPAYLDLIALRCERLGFLSKEGQIYTAHTHTVSLIHINIKETGGFSMY